MSRCSSESPRAPVEAELDGDAQLGDNGKITIETFNKPDFPTSKGTGGGPTVPLPPS